MTADTIHGAALRCIVARIRATDGPTQGVDDMRSTLSDVELVARSALSSAAGDPEVNGRSVFNVYTMKLPVGSGGIDRRGDSKA